MSGIKVKANKSELQRKSKLSKRTEKLQKVNFISCNNIDTENILIKLYNVILNIRNNNCLKLNTYIKIGFNGLMRIIRDCKSNFDSMQLHEDDFILNTRNNPVNSIAPNIHGIILTNNTSSTLMRIIVEAVGGLNHYLARLNKSFKNRRGDLETKNKNFEQKHIPIIILQCNSNSYSKLNKMLNVKQFSCLVIQNQLESNSSIPSNVVSLDYGKSTQEATDILVDGSMDALCDLISEHDCYPMHTRK